MRHKNVVRTMHMKIDARANRTRWERRAHGMGTRRCGRGAMGHARGRPVAMALGKGFHQGTHIVEKCSESGVVVPCARRSQLHFPSTSQQCAHTCCKPLRVPCPWSPRVHASHHAGRTAACPALPRIAPSAFGSRASISLCIVLTTVLWCIVIDFCSCVNKQQSNSA